MSNSTTNQTTANKENIWKTATLGVLIGDALGCPVQFETRREVAKHPVTGMRGHGTYNMPTGTWTDDGSMTLATLASIRKLGKIDLKDIMDRFVAWLVEGEYTQNGESFDIGGTTMDAIRRYMKTSDVTTCGLTGSHNNGNGSLMRIIPACLYCYDAKLPDDKAIQMLHAVSGLTHAHLRSKIACGLYYFMVKSILDKNMKRTDGDTDVLDVLQKGLDDGFAFYKKDSSSVAELAYYSRLTNLAAFATAPTKDIKSSGYVVDTLEAAVWSLITTSDFKSALLKAVNLGDDTDTVGAVTGGLAAIIYGYANIPQDWIKAMYRCEMIEKYLN